MKKALTIAGFDPSGGAGLQADLKVFQAHHVYGLSVVSSLTAQNTKGVSVVLPVEPGFIGKQLRVLLSDIRPDATKIGMLYTVSNVRTVVRCIKEFSLGNIVLDPVFVSSSGKKLALRAAVPEIRRGLLPLCKVITPNLYEAEVLSGMTISTLSDIENAARALKDLGPEHVVITGGHLAGEARDLHYNGAYRYFRAEKVPGEFHGTGCIFSAAIAAGLAKGLQVGESVARAKRFMKSVLKKTIPVQGRLKLMDVNVSIRD